MRKSANSSRQGQSERWNILNGWLTSYSSKKQTASGDSASTSLTSTSPKDSFPLPRIDLIVDATAGHELLSFMDAFSGYNQISMDPDDQEKTSFVTGQGTFYYSVMPFGLKNARATYQRLVNRMFQKQIGTCMEVYIDDMLVKSTTTELHIAHLSEAFQIHREYNMKLNPAKCAFGVSVEKFLGFIINN